VTNGDRKLDVGLDVGIFGRQAEDETGVFLRAAMAKIGIETDIRIVPAASGEASTTAEIFVDDAGERSIYMAPGTTSGTTSEHVRKYHEAFISNALALSTEVSQLPLDAALAAVEIARAAGVPTVVDFDVPASDALASLGDEQTLHALLAAADTLKPAKLAAREMFPEHADDSLAMADAMRERFGNDAVVVTDGEAGCAISSAAFSGRVAACSAKAIDSTGAGDAFLGGLLVARRRGLSWEESGRFANACGAACVEQMGAFPEDVDAARARVERFFAGPLPADASTNDSSGSVSSSRSTRAIRDDASSPEASSATDGPAAALHVLGVAADELAALRDRHIADAGRALHAAAELIHVARESGRTLHVTGLGKPEHLSRYAASLFSSTGTPASFLHATEATHGSLGQVREGDVVVAISNSGTTSEVVAVAELVRGFGARVIAVTGALGSPLAAAADVALDAAVRAEGGPLDLAPRASIVAETVVLAALSALVQERAGLTRAEYARRHPAGALGDRAGR
jgi:arabinose-5-phosphate isomerase